MECFLFTTVIVGLVLLLASMGFLILASMNDDVYDIFDEYENQFKTAIFIIAFVSIIAAVSLFFV